MAFDFHLHIPENSASGQVIQRLAEEKHITPEQAAERLLEEAAELHTPTKRREVTLDPEYLLQLKARGAARAAARRVTGDPMANARPEAPDALIGYLADAPEVAQTIRDLAYEHRASGYGV